MMQQMWYLVDILDNVCYSDLFIISICQSFLDIHYDGACYSSQVENPVVCGVSSLGYDHMEILG